ncbi:murein transglycosylase [Flavobacterium columnare]|uniref:Membrane-bound lytic murein transglycosylase n=3 Tax=Flavobacterium columnare TaxID=996 RepID=G8X9C0_FLACA|nr:membrane-bound lytic murein transglycosylase precursor [Flavobacterium columnare ATCC 49512]AMO18995.1 lytic transglycosylase domain-containing protein [Flavobacterium columnare]PDS23194.1 murein transglycosylase [Flavobacterium columnare] [Flavobacterium columnare NBRC 100251 = ATCC 23463]APT21506.1 murein transglycosylase [Flavobacterium columnare]MBF6652289.1 murein transglycosylase [Flavobacterium columnare]
MKLRNIVFFILCIVFMLVSWKDNHLFPIKIDFCGEEVPLDIPDVRERLDRELVINEYMHGSTILIIKRAYRFFPIIEPILAKNNVPDDFKYLAVIESSLTNATSPSGAKGFWQFMPQTAKENGMEVTEGVDERYHLEKATQAACGYLLKAKEKFGSWTLAAASYNGGMNGLQKAINQQFVTNYYDLLLTDETFRYVFRILALKEIMKNPKQYGFELNETELYKTLKTKKIEVDSTITDLAKFAKSQGVNYKELKLMNPWLRDVKLDNPNKKKYILDLPVK